MPKASITYTTSSTRDWLDGTRQIATQCTRKIRDVESKCGVVSGRLSTKGIKVIIEYSQHTNVEKLNYFGGGYVGLCERRGSPKIRMLASGKEASRIACTLSSSTIPSLRVEDAGD